MSKYRKKPVVIDAERFAATQEQADRLSYTLKWRCEHCNAMFAEYTNGCPHGCGMVNGLRRFSSGLNAVGALSTLEGEMLAQLGDWIITGVRGERYPCRHDIFTMTYEEVEP